jgi:hypothetical protein
MAGFDFDFDPVSRQMQQGIPQQPSSPWDFTIPQGGGGGVTPGMTPGVPTFMDSLKSFGKGAIGDKQSPGWLGPMATAGSGLVNAYTGYKQLQLGQDELVQNKREFDLNFGNQRQSYNTQIEDRQRARLSASPGGYESLSTYLDKNRV